MHPSTTFPRIITDESNDTILLGKKTQFVFQNSILMAWNYEN